MISFSDKFLDEKEIIESLSDKDKYYLFKGNWKDSLYTQIYRDVLLKDDIPIAFINLFTVPIDLDRNEVLVVATTKPECREKENIDILFNRMIEKIQLQDPNIDTFLWFLSQDNLIDREIAVEHGFTIQNERNIYSNEFDLFRVKMNFNLIPGDILSLYDKLRKFKHGILYNEIILERFSIDDLFGKYKTLTINEFETYEVGLCYDFVHYEATWFKEHGYDFQTFYLEGINDVFFPNHTFLTFTLPKIKGVFYFEVSWKGYNGIEKFENLDILIKTIKERFNKHTHSLPQYNIFNKYEAENIEFEGLRYLKYIIKVSNKTTRYLCTKFTLDDEAFKRLIELNYNKWIENRSRIYKGEKDVILIPEEVLFMGYKIEDIILYDKPFKIANGRTLYKTMVAEYYYDEYLRRLVKIQYIKMKYIDIVFDKMITQLDIDKFHFKYYNSNFINEDVLRTIDRKKLRDEDFGIPSQRKFPLNDEDHVLSAIRMFHHVDKKHEAELAKNIIKAMKKFNISLDTISKENKLYKYL